MKETKPNGRYGGALTVLRTARGLQQEELAELAGISSSYVSLIEAGKRIPTADTWSKLCSGLGCPESIAQVLAFPWRTPASDERRLGRWLARAVAIRGLE